MAPPPTPDFSSLPYSYTPLLSFINLSYPDHQTFWAAMLLALNFFALLWSGELLFLHRSNLHRTEEGYQVHIRQSKTDPFCSGAIVRVLPSGNPSLCAVTALDSYLVVQGPTDGMLFRLQTAAFMRQRLNSLIWDLASRCGVDPRQYSSHSFRIGAASTAASAGIPDWRIQALGCWSSDCYRRYVHLPADIIEGIAAALARTPSNQVSPYGWTLNIWGSPTPTPTILPAQCPWHFRDSLSSSPEWHSDCHLERDALAPRPALPHSWHLIGHRAAPCSLGSAKPVV